MNTSTHVQGSECSACGQGYAARIHVTHGWPEGHAFIEPNRHRSAVDLLGDAIEPAFNAPQVFRGATFAAPETSGCHDCPCCSDVTYADTLLCSECVTADCQPSTDAGGDTGYTNCERDDQDDQDTPCKPYVIAYFDQSPCDPRRFASVTACKDAFREDSRDYFASESATVYAADTEDTWAEAKRFEGIGCPFDYPTFLLTLGPRGGVVCERC